MASTIPTSRRVNLVINKLTKQSYDLLSADGRLSTELSDQLFMTTDEDEGGSGGGFVLPVATKYTLGGVKIGEGIDVATDGTISASGGSAPSIATKDTLGVVKIGDGIDVAADGTISASGGTPSIATRDALGVVKIGSGLDVATDGTISASGGSGPSMQDVFDTMYPISSVYIAVTDALPQFFSDHGTWERVSSGACLWGVEPGNHDKIGTILEAGLPTVSGTATGLTCSEAGSHQHSVYKDSNPLYEGGSAASGVAWSGSDYIGKTDSQGGHTHDITGTINITSTSGVYGKSSTVQPPAFVVSMWMRTA